MLVVVLDAQLAQAATVEAEGDCPRGPDVEAALAPLLRSSPQRQSTAVVTVRDLGLSWSVHVAGRTGTYPDPDRGCAERTRIAAIFAALVLEPPQMEEPPVVPAARVRPRTHRLDLAPAFLFAPGAGERDSSRTWGGSLRWSITGERAGLAVGLEAGAPSVANGQQYGVSLARISFDTSARVAWRVRTAELGFEFGPYGGLLRARGQGLYANTSSTHLDAGGRVAVRLGSASRRIWPFLALFAQFSARRFSLVVDPSGEVGTAPRIWLGLQLGGSFLMGHRN